MFLLHLQHLLDVLSLLFPLLPSLFPSLLLPERGLQISIIELSDLNLIETVPSLLNPLQLALAHLVPVLSPPAHCHRQFPLLRLQTVLHLREAQQVVFQLRESQEVLLETVETVDDLSILFPQHSLFVLEFSKSVLQKGQFARMIQTGVQGQVKRVLLLDSDMTLESTILLATGVALDAVDFLLDALDAVLQLGVLAVVVAVLLVHLLLVVLVLQLLLRVHLVLELVYVQLVAVLFSWLLFGTCF